VRRAAILLCLALAGCGAATPTTSTHTTPQPPPTAIDTVRAFATVYINWTATNITSRMRLLASVSVGQARAAMELAAAGTQNDYELKRGGISNSGTVEAVAPLAGGQYVVVTKELTSATNTTAYEALRPAWHVAVATVAQSGGQWVVSGWQPEN
jgi:hypothetical protein